MIHENENKKIQTYFATHPDARVKLWVEPMSGGACIHVDLGDSNDVVVSNFRFVPPSEMSNLDIFKGEVLIETIAFMPGVQNQIVEDATSNEIEIASGIHSEPEPEVETEIQDNTEEAASKGEVMGAVDIVSNSAIIKEAETSVEPAADAEPEACVLPNDVDLVVSETVSVDPVVEATDPAPCGAPGGEKPGSSEAEENADVDIPMSVEDAKNVLLEFKKRTKTVLNSPIAKYEGQPLSEIAPLYPSMLRFFALKSDDPKCFVTEKVSQASKILLEAKSI